MFVDIKLRVAFWYTKFIRWQNFSFDIHERDQIDHPAYDKFSQISFLSTLWSAIEILLPGELHPGGDGEEEERAKEADRPPDARQPQGASPLEGLPEWENKIEIQI